MDQADSFSLAALGKAGSFTVEVLGRPDGGWLFRCAVPAAHWWDDLVFT